MLKNKKMEQNMSMLKKYVPFLDYLISTGRNEKKFNFIKSKIENGDLCDPESLINVEKAIVIQYRSLSFNNRLPDSLKQIFRVAGGNTVSVDLCSDEEESVKIEDPTFPNREMAIKEEIAYDNNAAVGNDNHDSNGGVSNGNEEDETNNEDDEDDDDDDERSTDASMADDNTLVVTLVASGSTVVEDVGAIRRKQAQKSVEVPNVKKNMTEGNTKRCVLCKSKPRDLTAHYVRIHDTESYVSRLSETMLKNLRRNVPIATYRSFGPDYEMMCDLRCAICTNQLTDKFLSFYDHFSMHTGEYGFYCSKCNLKTNSKAKTAEHMARSKNCCNSNVGILYSYPDDALTIYLHRCRECNFVQLNEANVKKHIREHHSGGCEIGIEKLVLAQMSSQDLI